MTSWWKVQRGDEAVMVLVVGGRVAASSGAAWFTQIGDKWEEFRKRLSDSGFTSTMESAP